MGPCAAIPALLKKSQEIASACLQAEATISAAEVQAAAANDAGWMTFWAGVLALAAALIGAYAAFRSVKAQVTAAKNLQVEGQKHTVKKDVYLGAASALATGLMAIPRFADPRVPAAEVLAPYHAESPKISQVHMVAPLNVLQDVVAASMKMSEIHLDLLDRRLRMDALGQPAPAQVLTWGFYCVSRMPELIPAFIQGVASMRDDLNLPIDRSLYENLVRDMAEQARALTRESFARTRSFVDV